MERLGRYEVHAELGRGGMGVVYLAHDPQLDRDVAVKVLPETLQQDAGCATRFTEEARNAAGLSHPNIVKIFDVGQDDGRSFYAMEFVAGRDLGTELRGRGPLSLEETVRLLRPVADALDYAHSRGVIHRDIKPENILLTTQDQPILLDFGISRAGQGRGLTHTGTMLGTPDYMSPEQAEGAVALDHRSDIYSLGVVAFHMLVGRPPFEATTPVGVAVAHVNKPAPDVLTLRPDLAPSAAQALARVLRKNRLERFESAGAFVRALAGDAVVTQRTAPSGELAELRPRRLGGVLVGGMLAACLVLTGLVVLVIAARQRPAAGSGGQEEQPTPVEVAAAAMPDLVGLPEGDAVARIGAIGVVLARLDRVTKPGAQPGTVVVQWPTAGLPVPPEGAVLTVAQASVQLRRIRPVRATASSTLPPDQNGSYEPEELIDGLAEQAWNAGNRQLGTDGRGEWVRLELRSAVVVRRLRIFPGHGKITKYGSLFEKNSHLARVQAVLDNGFTQALVFDGRRAWSEFDLANEQPCRAVRLVVEDVYAGTKWPDLAIGEAEVYGY